MIAYSNLLARYNPETKSSEDFFGNPIQQVTPLGGETSMPNPYSVSGEMGTSSVQQGIGSLLGIIDQNINQNPETSRLMNLRQILLDYNNQFGRGFAQPSGGSMQPSRGFAQPLSQRLGGISPLMGFRKSLMPLPNTGTY
tara:strand:- start:944 stop:1363 length:420 start_codon:yes stop_codon:yes gene_type:complete